MAIDFSVYQPPGVYTESVPGPQIAVRSSLPTAVGIFGTSIGYRTFTESVEIPPDSSEDTPAESEVLSQPGIKTASIVVADPESGSVYTVNTDYVVVRKTAGSDLIANTRDDLYTIKRVVDGGHIDPGDTVQVTYQYTDAALFTPTIFYDYDDVRDMYGPPFNTTKSNVNGVAPGGVLSELTLAAKFAFLNGAYQVVCVAVDRPDPAVAATAGEYGAALDLLRDEELVSVVVPATGMQSVHELVHQHVTYQSQNKYERTAIVARDGTTTTLNTTQRQEDAANLTDQRVAMVSPAKFLYFSPELNKEVNLGGQFMAASLAGRAVSMNTAMPLTRKTLVGWRDVVWPGSEGREGSKNLETKNGLMVVEKTRRQLIQVRHGVTTDPTDLLTREWSIIRQQDAMVFRIRDYLENDNLIGQPIYDTTLINVKASAESALQSLKRDLIIRDYKDLKVRQLETLPDVIEVRYAWLPAYPLNYIVVRYAVTLPSGDMTLVSS